MRIKKPANNPQPTESDITKDVPIAEAEFGTITELKKTITKVKMIVFFVMSYPPSKDFKLYLKWVKSLLRSIRQSASTKMNE